MKSATQFIAARQLGLIKLPGEYPTTFDRGGINEREVKHGK
jgi:hypothetical protein